MRLRHMTNNAKAAILCDMPRAVLGSDKPCPHWRLHRIVAIVWTRLYRPSCRS